MKIKLGDKPGRGDRRGGEAGEGRARWSDGGAAPEGRTVSDFKLPRGFVPSAILKNPPALGARIHHLPPEPVDPIEAAIDELARVCAKAAAGLDRRVPLPAFPRRWVGIIAWPDGWRGGV